MNSFVSSASPTKSSPSPGQQPRQIFALSPARPRAVFKPGKAILASGPGSHQPSQTPQPFQVNSEKIQEGKRSPGLALSASPSHLKFDDDYFQVADQAQPSTLPTFHWNQERQSLMTPRSRNQTFSFQSNTPSRLHKLRLSFNSELRRGIQMFPLPMSSRRAKSTGGQSRRESQSERKLAMPILTPKRANPASYVSSYQSEGKISSTSASMQQENSTQPPSDSPFSYKLSFIQTSNLDGLEEEKASGTPSESLVTEIRRLEDAKFRNAIFRLSYSTKAGVSFDGRKKINQDSYIVKPKLAGNCIHLFGVCDGHGPMGDSASKFVAGRLKEILQAEINTLRKDNKLHGESQQDLVVESLRRSHILTNYELVTSDIDTKFSGSTACSVLFVGHTAYFCNVGDSRAIAGKMSKNGKWSAQILTRDHKPGDRDERKRIERTGGDVHPYLEKSSKKYLGPLRVYSKQGEYPGLAMSRSMGDEVAKKLGVVAEPEVNILQLEEEHKFVILASDGVWEFLSNEDIIRLAIDAYHQKDPEAGVTRIMKEALKEWRKRESTVDDITCVMLHLK